ncbi:hypothetical protein [Crateriforma conspicua]|uniref:Uncharacterized protein n=1 Tax=Crateriforma conspicua TaxID=2527996 RepID=A0A5C5Y9Q6_9PLAN|nr:hypothetical protein [Crateriforma conspicua]TWT71648.1 hypothetical protein Pan14r_39580 [Crateriforma conspicua]
MSTSQKYSVNQHLIETLPSWVKSGEIAIPEIQCRFATITVHLDLTFSDTVLPRRTLCHGQ